ncbi:MAG: sigma-70 family RNA polymerase sigma factor, partial [Gemmataceae bacterium]|nr:sigma-70 family RNA polymerase sigma factor [Gemmataceae bacterium]
RETPAGDAPEPAAPQPPPPAADLSALQAALDDELARLPERLRLPVVLCHLEGLSHEAVAKQLGVTDGQLRGRLYRAKLKLQDRLTRRGFTLTAVLLALAVNPPASALPPVLAAGTLRLATTPDAAVPAAVLALTHGVTPAMFTLTKAVAAAAVLGTLGLGAGGWAVRSAVADDPAAPATQPAAQPATAKAARPDPAAKPDDDKPADPKDKVETVRGEIKLVDATKVRVKPDEAGQPELSVAPGDGGFTFHGKPVKPADLKPGMRAEIDYRGNSTEFVAARAYWPPRRVTVKSVSVADRTFSIETGGDEGGFEIVLAVAPDAEVVVDGLPAGLADVPVGRRAEVSPSLDRKAVVAVRSAGDPADLPALVVGYNSTSRTLLVSFEADQGDVRRPVTLALPVGAGAKARLAGKDLPLAEVKPRMPARLRLSGDRTTVTGLLLAAPLPEEKDDDKDD